MNNIVLIGNMVREPEAFQDKGFAKISVADNDGYGEKEHTTFYDVLLWGQKKDYVMQYRHKGDRVIICGSLSTNEWESENGVKRVSFSIRATDIQLVSRPKEAEAGSDVFAAVPIKKKKEAEDPLFVEVDSNELPF